MSTRQIPRTVATAPVNPRMSDEDLATIAFGSHGARRDAALMVIRDRYQGALVGYARRIVGNGADAEEVAQDVLAALFAGEAPAGALRPFLYCIARNRAIDRLRHERTRAGWQDGALRLDLGPGHVPLADSAADIVTQLETKETLRAITHAVQRLSKTHQTVFVNEHGAGMSLREAAAARDVSEKAEKSERSRVTRKLRQDLVAQGYDVPSGRAYPPSPAPSEQA